MKFREKVILSTIMFIPLLLLISIAQTNAATPQETLNQYIVDLQKSPNDNALRENIIKHVQTMRPAPAIPEDAERYMARGTAAVKSAKTEQDFLDAAVEFEKASLVAPWLADIYYNLGITQDKAGKYQKAIQNLKLYLVAAPGASDTKAVKNMMYEIEYRQEKAAKESSPEAIAERKQTEYETWLKKIDGARYIYKQNLPNSHYDITIDIKGKRIVMGGMCTWDRDPDNSFMVGRWDKYREVELQGREFRVEGKCFRPFEFSVISVYVISNDGNSIKMTSPTCDSGGKEYTSIEYWRQR